MERILEFVLLVMMFVASEERVKQSSYRLPLEVVPLAYNLTLVPFLNDAGNRSFTFDGVTVITVKVQKVSRNITLHAKDITIKEIIVSDMKVLEFGVEEKRDFLTIHLKQTLKPGTIHNITMRYTGKMRNDRAGFYRSSYEIYHKRRWLASTQFQSTDARRAFPCFDEPALKATYVIRIAAPDGHNVVSNMPVASITGPDSNTQKRYWYTFQRSVPMSSYLVAFVVSDFPFVEHGPFRILTNPYDIDNTRYLLSVTPTLLEIMENLTGVNYTLPKMDQVAVPDFAAGAMENWGLVTFRYELLDSTKQDIAVLIAHEFAHQWFGNLVSPQWWTYTWLSEGTATFFESFVISKLEPEWNTLSTAVTDIQHSALELDAIREFSHPITRPVETPTQITTSFDSITYLKGGSLIKMIQHFLTETTFFKGLNYYLNSKAFGTAVADDLFAALQKAASKDRALPTYLSVKRILDTWTLQAGYPVLTVTRNYAAGTATITQKRFFTSGSGGDESWWVPVSYTTRGDADFNRTAPRAWLAPGASLTLDGLAADDWLLLNIQDAAFYRINYDQQNWDLLLTALEQSDYDGIHPLNRAQLLDDTAQLGEAQLVPPDFSLRALKALHNESDPTVWRTALRVIKRLYLRLANTDAFPAFQEAFGRTLEGWARGEGAEDAGLSKQTINDWAYALSDNFARRTLADYVEENSTALWCALVRSCNSMWDDVWLKYEMWPEYLSREALVALGCARDPQRLLAATVSDGVRVGGIERSADSNTAPRRRGKQPERVRSGGRLAALAAPCGSETREAVGGGGPRACEQTIEFFARNMDREDFFEDPDDYLTLLRRFATRVRTEGQYEKLQLAVTTYQAQVAGAVELGALAQLLRDARANVEWAAGEGAGVVRWLRRHAPDATTPAPDEDAPRCERRRGHGPRGR